MTVKKTSIQSFAELQLEKLDHRVYAALYDGAIKDNDDADTYICTRRELAYYMNEQASTVSGAVNRLIKKGWVVTGAPIKCLITGRMVEHILPAHLKDKR